MRGETPRVRGWPITDGRRDPSSDRFAATFSRKGRRSHKGAQASSSQARTSGSTVGPITASTRAW
jgi:hypothetical protein